MRSICLLAILLTLSFTSNAQSAKSKKPAESIREYWFVLLVKGPHRDQDSATAAQIQRGHLANITRLYNEGKIKVAGPFGEEGDWQGIFIFDAASREEVEKLLQSDPAIKAGRLNYQIKSWYTAAMGSFVPGKPKVKF